jgi:hypothetical protein
MPILPCWARTALVFWAGVACSTSAAAVEDDATTVPEPPANKLTVAYYDFSSGKNGADINVRHTFKSSTAWVGAYHESDKFDQVRFGYEYDYHESWRTFVPAVQVASHGFVGFTLYGEAGKRYFAIGGYGRTNLQPYWNLGFDPNDYAQFGGGFRDSAGNTVSVYAIHDIRLGTGQTNTHLYFRRHLNDWRFTLDVVKEHGTGDNGQLVNTWSASLDTDWRRFFVRVAADPHVNYTADHQLRVASGWRF